MRRIALVAALGLVSLLARSIDAQTSAPLPAAKTPAATRPVAPPAPIVSAPQYDLLYDVRLVPGEGMARVTLTFSNLRGLVRRLRFRPERERQFGFRGDGRLEATPDAVEWEPPTAGGSLEYAVRLDRLRNERSYEARCAKSWAIFRGDDLVPPAHVVTTDAARARARLRMRLPEGWSVATPYPKGSDGTFSVEHAQRRFDRPVGWFVAGHLGVVREKIAGSAVAIAGPRGHGLRRLDQLVLLRLVLPSLRDAFGGLPERLLLVGAGDPMWRGGLSGPASLFLHADRPLLSSDTTSPLLHELVHVVLRARSGPDGDWITEGLAEWYAIDLLARSHAIGRRRHERALQTIEARGRAAPRLLVRRASAEVTARAVGVMRALDRELRDASNGTRGLDDLVRAMIAQRGEIGTARFVRMASAVGTRDLTPFFRRQIGEDWAPEERR